MSKKRKAHNPHKRRSAYSRALLRRLQAVVVYVAGQNDGAVRLINFRTGENIPVYPQMVSAIADVPHDWTVLCAALCRRQDGEEYMRSVQTVKQRCYQDQIADALNDVHMDLVRESNPLHRVGVAWIACPWGDDIAEEDAARLFEKLDAWCLEPGDIRLEDVA